MKPGTKVAAAWRLVVQQALKSYHQGYKWHNWDISSGSGGPVVAMAITPRIEVGFAATATKVAAKVAPCSARHSHMLETHRSTVESGRPDRTGRMQTALQYKVHQILRCMLLALLRLLNAIV